MPRGSAGRSLRRWLYSVLLVVGIIVFAYGALTLRVGVLLAGAVVISLSAVAVARARTER